MSTPAFLNLGTSNIWGWICCRACPLRCKTFGSIPGLYPRDASNTLFLQGTKKVPKSLPEVPWMVESTPVENHCFKRPFHPALHGGAGKQTPLQRRKLRPKITQRYVSNPELLNVESKGLSPPLAPSLPSFIAGSLRGSAC